MPVLENVLSFEARPSSLCALAACSRSCHPAASEAWKSLAVSTVGAVAVRGVLFESSREVHDLRSMRELLMEVVLSMAPMSVWLHDYVEETWEEGIEWEEEWEPNAPEILQIGLEPMVAGSYALWAYLTKQLMVQVPWTPNDVDLWFPNRGNVEFLAKWTAKKIKHELPMWVRTSISNASHHNYGGGQGGPAPPSCSPWTVYFAGTDQQRRITPEHMRGGRCMVTHVVDLHYGLLADPDMTLGKLSFIGTCAGMVGSFHWRQVTCERPLSHKDILSRFDINVCKIGFFPASLAFLMNDPEDFEKSTTSGTARQEHCTDHELRSRTRRSKYEERGFVFTSIS